MLSRLVLNSCLQAILPPQPPEVLVMAAVAHLEQLLEDTDYIRGDTAGAACSMESAGREQEGAPPATKLPGQEPQASGCSCGRPAVALDPGIPALSGAQEAPATLRGSEVSVPSSWPLPPPSACSRAEPSCG